MIKKIDKVWVGIVVGILFPAIFGYLFITNKMQSSESIFVIIQQLKAQSLLFKFGILDLLPNLLFLYVFSRWDAWKLIKGVVLSTLAIALAIATEVYIL